MEEIAKQFPTKRREMIFCAIPKTEKWPFWHYLEADNIFFSVGNQIFLYNFNTATHGGHKNYIFDFFLTGCLSYGPKKHFWGHISSF
jgi:hypothetical protein